MEKQKFVPRIVAGVGISANSKNPHLAKQIEKAMQKAVHDCALLGVTDPLKIRAAIQAAREEVKRKA